MNKFYVIGCDDRSNYVRMLYSDNIVDIDDAKFIIAPIPFSRDGVRINGENIYVDDFIESIKGKTLFSGAFLKDIEKKLTNVKYYDLMKIDSMAILNAIPTAEGAIYETIKNSYTTLCGSNCLIMGYGRIGKVLAKMLNGIGANVYCEARKEKDLALIQAMGYNEVNISNLKSVLPNMDYIFNTIPVVLLDEGNLKLVKQDALIIDLASTPGGVDFDMANKLGVNVVWALSLPSKVAPKSAAKYIKETIDKIMEEQNDSGCKKNS